MTFPRSPEPALFDGKMLKRVSTCPWHPKFQAKRAPKGNPPCPACVKIWEARP